MSNAVRWTPEYYNNFQRRQATTRERAAKAVEVKDEPTEFRVKLPWPPSVNHAIDGNNHRTPALRAFLENAVAIARMEYAHQGYKTTLRGRVAVQITFVPPDARSDLDNRIKYVLDALQHAGIYENDRQVREIAAAMMDPLFPGEGSTVVTVRTL